MYKIESIPVKPGNSKYPFSEMLVGESFICPHYKVLWAAKGYGKKYNKKFAVRKEGEMYRCGRIA